ncbi:Dimer Tnp hAT domain-containing protein [Aphis craccivora]|uniref:Dimer Tnp hAT domain-containing protein n=1 Tax=Aphis craccivora TaxID=307492 RepID=A0A6G0Y6Y8_APHCR|nr:Dimer Tnp hAT domain-containing protein [Aphis craccivora]
MQLRTINLRRKDTVKRLFKSRSKVTKFSGPDKDYGDIDTELECDQFKLDPQEFENKKIELPNSIPESNEHREDISICLPDHMKCCAHYLNLIATTDIAKITDRSYLQISNATFEKLFKFWNLVSRSTTASDIVKKLIPLFEELKLNKLKTTEWLFLQEYCEVMEPLASALDKLQGEKKSKAFIIASISHPKFKMNWVPIRYRSFCRNVFVSECNTLSAVINSSPNSGSSSKENDESDDNEFFNNLLQSSFPENFIDDNSNESHCSTKSRNINLAGIQSSSFLNSKKEDLTMLDSFGIVQKHLLLYVPDKCKMNLS